MHNPQVKHFVYMIAAQFLMLAGLCATIAYVYIRTLGALNG